MNKFLYIFLSLLLLFSCTSSHHSSFSALADSFSDWNLKFSSTPSLLSSYENILYADKKFSEDLYLNDIKRFSIELNQINHSKLDNPKRLEYFSIKLFLDNQIFRADKLNFHKWNLIDLLNKSLYHLYYINYLTNQKNINSELVSKEINYLNNSIVYIIKNIEQQYAKDQEKEIVLKLIQNINSVFDEMNSLPSAAYYKKNFSILGKTVSALENWHVKEYVKFEIIDDALLKKHAKEYISLSTNFKGELDSVLFDATKNLSLYKKELFDVSLSIYLLNNDEPIWVDIEDSTKVINWTLDSLRKAPYNCSDKMSIINLSGKNISSIDSDAKGTNLKHISYNNSLLGDYKFYSIENDSLTIHSSGNSSNLIDNYYESLEEIFPGNIYIEKILNNSKTGFNSIHVNRNYLEGFKTILIDYYLNHVNHKTIEKEICGLNNFEYIPALKIYFLLDRIEDCIGAISTIKYLLNDKDINSTIENNDYYKLINDERKEIYKKEIFSYDMSSLIKFISYNRLMKLYKNEKFNKNRLGKIVNLLHENPNLNLQHIERILK